MTYYRELSHIIWWAKMPSWEQLFIFMYVGMCVVYADTKG